MLYCYSYLASTIFLSSDLIKWNKNAVHHLGSLFVGLKESDIPSLTKDMLQNLNTDLLDGNNFTDSFKKSLAAHFVKVSYHIFYSVVGIR